MGLDALKELIVPQEARELTGQTSVIVGKKAIDTVGDEVAHPAGAHSDDGQPRTAGLQGGDAEGLGGRGLQVDVCAREGLGELSALDAPHELNAVGQAGLGDLPGESLTQRAVPVDLEDRIGAGGAPDRLSEGAHDLQGALALDPPQGGHDRDRPVRPSFLGAGALQVPVLDGDAIG